MSLWVDSARGASSIRRPRKAATERSDDAVPAEEATLPVPVGRARTLASGAAPANASAIEAQVIGERRGLRAGATVHDIARQAYNRAQWSGSNDRRTPSGRLAKARV